MVIKVTQTLYCCLGKVQEVGDKLHNAALFNWNTNNTVKYSQKQQRLFVVILHIKIIIYKHWIQMKWLLTSWWHGLMNTQKSAFSKGQSQVSIDCLHWSSGTGRYKHRINTQWNPIRGKQEIFIYGCGLFFSINTCQNKIK